VTRQCIQYTSRALVQTLSGVANQDPDLVGEGEGHGSRILIRVADKISLREISRNSWTLSQNFVEISCRKVEAS
jgi:hypothetical protein